MSSFLALPADIRNKIYESALPLDGSHTTISTAHRRNRPAPVPALCRANRQARAETLPMLRGRNHYELVIISNSKKNGREPALVRWLRQFRGSGAASLRMLHVRGTIVLPWPCGFGGVKCKAEVDLWVEGREYYLVVTMWWECPARRGGRDVAWVKGKVREEWVRVIGVAMGRELAEMRESLENGGL